MRTGLERSERIERAIESVDVDLAVRLSQEVSRIPSVLGDEAALAAFLAETMRAMGFENVALQPALPGRPNALGQFDFGPGRTALLTGHLDTKPVSHGWTATTPYSGDLIDGAVYGHGIMDMKAALVCQIAAMAGIAGSGIELEGTLAFAAVSDHMGDQLGSIAYFASHSADLCVLGELTDNTVCVGHRGRYYYDVHVYGRSAHTMHKSQAINANYLAALATIELEKSCLEPMIDDVVAERFGTETYMVPGRIYGGLPPGGPSMIPDECVIRVDCRPQPGVSTEVVEAEVRRCLDAAQKVDPRFRADVLLADEKPGYIIDDNAEVVQIMIEALNGARGGHRGSSLSVQGWLGDTASFGDLAPTVIFGPGGEPVYCPDEHLSIDDISEATRAYGAFAALALCPQ